MILKTGSKVKIVNYGSPVLIPKKNYKPGTFPILEESEYSYMVDTAPQLIGKEGIITSQFKAYGEDFYNLEIEGEIKSGFLEKQLELC